MSERFLQILLYLFGHYLAEDLLDPVDTEHLVKELSNAGFARKDAKQVIEWLAGTKTNSAVLALKESGSVRIFTTQEIHKLDIAARGFLHNLERNGVLDGVNRERIIDRAMALKTDRVGLPEIRYLTHMLLSHDGPKIGDKQNICQLLLLDEGIKH